MRSLSVAVLVYFALPYPLIGQWTNRYPKVAGLNHHVYLEGYELPSLTSGPIDPAPAPDGVTVAFASRGWIWLFDARTRIATRLTDGGPIDSRPTWSPDGLRIAFVRDDSRDTWIVVRDLESGQESIINTPAIDLDPEFSANGVFLYYASASAGTIDIWRRNLSSETDSLVVIAPGTQLRPQIHPNDRSLLFLEKRGADAIRMLDLESGVNEVLIADRLATMSRPALSPDGLTVAYNWPTQERYELRLFHVDDPASSVFLTSSRGLPLTPAWTNDGRWIYFAEADRDENFHLNRIASTGGPVEEMRVAAWEWGEGVGTVRIVTHNPARVSVVDQDGHPAIPLNTQSRFDGENGRVFFYSPGLIELSVPAGSATVSVTRGLATPERTIEVSIEEGQTTEVVLEPTPVWDPRQDGWLSGDHHFHLNYGGLYQLEPSDLALMMEAEDLDVATPLLANLHNRFEDQQYWTGPSSGSTPMVRFGQEVRSHFLGHVGLIGVTDLFWPWIWGPGYQVYGADDRPNTEPLQHARRQGGLSIYVHPFGGENPFSEEGMGRVPVELVADGVLGAFDLLEIVCLWSNDPGTSELWYRFLNLGVPIAPSGGTDVMNNFYRTMAIGTARVYVHTDGERSWDTYKDGLRRGKSFVTTGPLLNFRVAGSRPGETVDGATEARWNLDLHSASAVDRVEILVNGEVVYSSQGLSEAGSTTLDGNVDLPSGGWIAARVLGGESEWPGMSTLPFAHTAPVWIDSVGSYDPEARARSATELLRLLDVSTARLRSGYTGTDIPRLEETFQRAADRLRSLADSRS